MRISSSVGSAADLGDGAACGLETDLAEAAGFFFLGGAGAAVDFFFGSIFLDLPLADCKPESSAGLWSAELLGFLGTVFVSKCFQTEYPMRRRRKRILQR
jgi:hypothetical protein